MDDATLYLGDCLDVLRDLETGSVDAVVTDPPYGTHDLAGGYGRRRLWDTGNHEGRTIANDHDLSALAAAFPEFRRLVQDGWAAVFYAARRTPEFIGATSGEDWFGSLVWDKGAPGLGYHIRYAHEDVAVFRFGQPKRPDRALLSVIHCGGRRKEHPNEKPVEVMARIVEWASAPGGNILDPFMGSGTTGVACVQTGRRFVGVEIDPTYYAIAERRIAEARAQLPLPLAEGAGSCR